MIRFDSTRDWKRMIRTSLWQCVAFFSILCSKSLRAVVLSHLWCLVSLLNPASPGPLLLHSSPSTAPARQNIRVRCMPGTEPVIVMSAPDHRSIPTGACGALRLAANARLGPGRAAWPARGQNTAGWCSISLPRTGLPLAPDQTQPLHSPAHSSLLGPRVASVVPRADGHHKLHTAGEVKLRCFPTSSRLQCLYRVGCHRPVGIS